MHRLLAALGSCRAIDIISILKKQRQKTEQFKIEGKGGREKDVVPSLWKKVTVIFFLWGDVDTEKAQKAADLSMENTAQLRKRSGEPEPVSRGKRK